MPNLAADHQEWLDLMDQVKSIKDLRSDTSLALYLGVTRAMVSFVRNERQDFTTIMKLRILNGLGRITTDQQCVQALQKVLPTKISDAIANLEYLKTPI